VSRYRKHILSAVLVLMALWYASDWLLKEGFHSPLEPRRARTARLNEQIRARKAELAEIRKTGKQIELWKQQSLPSNIEVARSLYQGWLLDLIKYAQWTNPTVDSGEPVNRNDMYHVLSFTVRGRATLEQMTRFLFAFYGTGHLHQIRSIDISPAQRKGLLDLSITIEALALAGLKKDGLTPGPADRLVYGRLADYQGIVRRNLFGIGGGGAGSARLTAVISADDRLQAWFTLDDRAEVVHLFEGQTLETAAVRAKVVEIDAYDVVLEVDGERWLLSIGESLAQASALPPGT
jgi:hypothetical protein